MAQPLERQGYKFFACERCGFAYKEANVADECAAFDARHGLRSADITGKSIAPPHRYYQAALKFLDEELKAKAKAAKAAAAPGPGAAAPGAAPAAENPAPPKLSPEELEARRKAALDKAAAAKAAKPPEQP
jgi:hypothetical protein